MSEEIIRKTHRRQLKEDEMRIKLDIIVNSIDKNDAPIRSILQKLFEALNKRGMQ